MGKRILKIIKWLEDYRDRLINLKGNVLISMAKNKTKKNERLS